MEHDAGAADLAEGAMREVEIDGVTVLLARSGGRCHAVGARCPHAGGPLAKGVLDHGAVICPWHKAAFRLDDGRCLEPPAIDDLPRYTVREAEGRLLVTPAAHSTAPAPEPDNRCFTIMGAGAAGIAAAQTLRESGFGGRIVLVSDEDRLPYDRTVLSKYALSGKKGAEKTPLHAAEFYERHNIERRNARVARFDATTRQMTFTDGTTLDGDATLLAPGGIPRRLKVPGADLPGVFTLRSPADAEAIVRAANPPRRVIVAGAGFIGMEAAASLCERGLDVTVVAPQDAPFADKLGPRIGAAFRRLHESKGVRFRLPDEVAVIEGDGCVQSVRLGSGDTLPADIVIVGLGVSPVTGMLQGLPQQKDGGIEVDAHLQAAPGIYAAGDIAAFPHRADGPRIRVEHWRVAQQHGRVAALNMMGRSTAYDAVPYFWTIHFMKRLDYVGHAETWDDIEINGELDTPDFMAFYVKDNHVAAVAGWGRDQAMARVIGLMTDRRDWTASDLRRALSSTA